MSSNRASMDLSVSGGANGRYELMVRKRSLFSDARCTGVYQKNDFSSLCPPFLMSSFSRLLVHDFTLHTLVPSLRTGAHICQHQASGHSTSKLCTHGNTKPCHHMRPPSIRFLSGLHFSRNWNRLIAKILHQSKRFGTRFIAMQSHVFRQKNSNENHLPYIENVPKLAFCFDIIRRNVLLISNKLKFSSSTRTWLFCGTADT